MNIPNSECPVPLDQRPMNEYTALKASSFFYWTTRPLKDYIKKSLSLLTLIYGLIGILLIASFSNSEAKINLLIYNISFGTFILVLIFLRLYLGWLYIYERLVKATVSYEESGWYDGQIWIKTPEILIQDTLIAKYELLPIINRLKLSLISCVGIVIISLIYLTL